MPTHTFTYPHTFSLESGQILPSFQLAYTTYGQLNAQRNNVIWVCHAFTGSPDVMDWWGVLFGEGKYFDPKHYFIVCANMLGSCYGSTGPLSRQEKRGDIWYHDFPLLTNKDMVRAFELLRKELGIEQVHALIGGSMGGQHVLEWAIMNPDVFEYIIPIATNAVHSPWGIAFNEAQRMAILADPSWQERDPEAGLEGMKAARAMAMLSYRSYDGFEIKQSEASSEKLDEFRASTYQRYMGEKLSRRFNAFTYWYLSKAMDSHHVGRGRAGTVEALEQIKAKAIVIALKGDMLYPPSEQQFLARHIPHSSYHEISSLFGHDGFLVESKAFEEIFRNFLAGGHLLLKK